MATPDKAYLQEGHITAIVTSFVAFVFICGATMWRASRETPEQMRKFKAYALQNKELIKDPVAYVAGFRWCGSPPRTENAPVHFAKLTASLVFWSLGLVCWFIALLAMSFAVTGTNSPGWYNFRDNVRNVTYHDFSSRGTVDSDWMLAVLILELISFISAWMYGYMLTNLHLPWYLDPVGAVASGSAKVFNVVAEETKPFL